MKPEQKRRLDRAENLSVPQPPGCPTCHPTHVWIRWPDQEPPTHCRDCGRLLPLPDPSGPTWTVFWPHGSDPQAEWRWPDGTRAVGFAPPAGIGGNG